MGSVPAAAHSRPPLSRARFSVPTHCHRPLARARFSVPTHLPLPPPATARCLPVTAAAHSRPFATPLAPPAAAPRRKAGSETERKDRQQKKSVKAGKQTKQAGTEQQAGQDTEAGSETERKDGKEKQSVKAGKQTKQAGKEQQAGQDTEGLSGKAGKETKRKAQTMPVGAAPTETEFKSVLHLCGRATAATAARGCNCLAFAIHGELRRITVVGISD